MDKGKREEVTDVINESAYDDPNFKKGLVLKFDNATIKITKVDRKNKRTWGQHIELVDMDTGMSHYGHLVDTSDRALKEYGVPYCGDCEVPINQPSTEDGDKKALDRADEEGASDDTETR